MKSSMFILTVLATSFTAAEVKKEDYFPECSIDCLNDGTEKATDCSATDAVCWCVQSNYEAIYNQALACVLKECGADKATGISLFLFTVKQFITWGTVSLIRLSTFRVGSPCRHRVLLGCLLVYLSPRRH